MKPIAKAKGVSIAQIALAWLLYQKAVTSVTGCMDFSSAGSFVDWVLRAPDCATISESLDRSVGQTM